MATKQAAPAPAPAAKAPVKPAPVAVKPAAKPAAAAPAAANGEAAASGQGRKIILPNGEARVDYIKRRFAEGAKRGAIAKELSEMTGMKVAYQIVFAATKTKKAAVGAEEGEGEGEAA